MRSDGVHTGLTTPQGTGSNWASRARKSVTRQAGTYDIRAADLASNKARKVAPWLGSQGRYGQPGSIPARGTPGIAREARTA